MAIKGTFTADFSSFQAAVAGATVKLNQFEANSTKVGSALTRMANSLSGTKLIQDATLMTKAVEQVGGVSKLTEKELARVSAQASEAAAKMKAMGLEVPPGMQKIADATRKVDDAHGSLLSSVKSVALGFAAMFTARAAFNFVADVLRDASALKDLSLQTHISTSDLQVLGGAMSEFGVDADTLGRSLFALSRRIATGDDSIADALLTMGMSLKEVQGLEGEALFVSIERGLSRLQGSLRDTTASELFGSRLGMAMAGASEGVEEAIATWRKFNTVVSKESIDAMDAYDESIKRTKASLSAMAANMIGPVAQGFNVLVDASMRGASSWDIFVAMAKDFVLSNSVTGMSTTHLATLLDHLNTTTVTVATTTQAATTTFHSMAGATKRAADATKELAKWTTETGVAYQKMLSDARNLQGQATFDDYTATLERRKQNAEGMRQLEIDLVARARESAAQMKRDQDDAIAGALIPRTPESKKAEDVDRAAMQAEQTSAIMATWKTEESAWKAHSDTLLTGAAQMFAIIGLKSKKAAIAGALISTYQAIAKSLTAAPWPFNLVLAAGAAAAGFAQVAAIRAQSSHRTGTRNLDFQNFGTHSTAELHGQEAVIPRGGGHRLAGEIASALGGRSTGRSLVLNFSMPVQAWDGADVERQVREKALPVLLNALRHNWDNFRGDFARANA